MAVRKTARKTYTCGECKYFDKTNSVCGHEEMNKVAVSADTMNTPCGGKCFVPLDDYEGN